MSNNVYEQAIADAKKLREIATHPTKTLDEYKLVTGGLCWIIIREISPSVWIRKAR